MGGVLIVDDHAGFRRMVRALLEAAGYAIVGEADDAVAALRAVHDLHPDVVLLDVQLPDHDGFWVADELAAEGETPRIVFTSSRLASDYGSRVLDRAAGFVHKADLSRPRLLELLGAP